MPTTSELRNWLAHSLTYEAYLEIMREEADQPTDGLAEEDAQHVAFTQLNLHRTERIGRTYRIAAELADLLARLPGPETWLAITEPWCGDSAQCLPHIAVMAATRPALDLRILLRDDNPDVMDRYLTDGKRSIPRLVVLAADGRELMTWGPRPAAAQAVFDAARDEGLEKPQILERLHLFYGRDRGRALEREFIALLGARLGGDG